MKYSDLATRYLKDANVSASHSKREKWLIAEFADWLDKHTDQQGAHRTSCVCCRENDCQPGCMCWQGGDE